MSIGHYPCDCAQLNVTCGHANCMSGTHVKHDNIPVKIDGVEVGRANVRVFDDHIEVDVLEMVDGWTGYEYLRTYKRGAWQNVSMAFLKDFGDDPFIGEMIFLVMDRHFRPWLYPKVSPFPQFELFPRWTRFRRSKWIRWIGRR